MEGKEIRIIVEADLQPLTEHLENITEKLKEIQRLICEIPGGRD